MNREEREYYEKIAAGKGVEEDELGERWDALEKLIEADGERENNPRRRELKDVKIMYEQGIMEEELFCLADKLEDQYRCLREMNEECE